MDIKEQFRPGSSPENPGLKGAKRPHLSIYWKCCHRFSRIYPGRKGEAYEGRCPSCGAPLSVPIGKGGTSQRTFIAE